MIDYCLKDILYFELLSLNVTSGVFMVTESIV